MQTSLLKKLLHPISRIMSRRAEKLSEATSEAREESEMQNAECEMQNAEGRMQNSSPVIAGGGLQSDTEGANSPEVSVSDSDNDVSSDKSAAEKNTENEEPTEVATTENSNKAHLTSSVPRVARIPQGALSKSQMAEIREIFGDIDDAEIQRLYKRVTK